MRRIAKGMGRMGMFAVVIGMAGLPAQPARAASAYAWGDNANGQLGNGDILFLPSSTPIAVNGLSSGVTAIAAGGDHSLAVRNGGVWAWGDNSTGQLGNGSTGGTYAPFAVSGLSSGVTAIAGGGAYSLAIQNGGVLAWGSSQYGQLGDGMITMTSSSTPGAVVGLSSGVTSIAAGFVHSLAVQNGGIWAWGSNNNGQLGNGTTNPDNTFPFGISTPVAVTGLSSGVTAIAAGDGHSLAVQNGGVWAWGYNGDGELGNGTTTDSNTPVAVTGLSSGVTAIAAGGFSSLAVRNGGVWAWGSGQLTPVQIDPTDLTNIIAVADAYSSSYALSSDGSVWDWGDNSAGQLGLGNFNSPYPTPQHLLPPSGFAFTSLDANAVGFHVVATLTAVPEPGSALVLALGSAAMLLRRRRVVMKEM